MRWRYRKRPKPRMPGIMTVWMGRPGANKGDRTQTSSWTHNQLGAGPHSPRGCPPPHTHSHSLLFGLIRGMLSAHRLTLNIKNEIRRPFRSTPTNAWTCSMPRALRPVPPLCQRRQRHQCTLGCQDAVTMGYRACHCPRGTKQRSLHWGLSPGPSVYRTDALPLSYRGS